MSLQIKSGLNIISALRKYKISVFSTPSAVITGLTNNPTYGQTAQDGVQLTAVASNLDELTVTGYQWRTVESATTLSSVATYTPNGSVIDLDNLYCVVTLSDASTINTSTYVVRYAPPVAGSLVGVNETQGIGTPTVNLAAGFTGSGLVYTENASWASITGSSLTIDDAVRTDTITITATNSGGAATVDLSVTISSAPYTIIFGELTPIGAGGYPTASVDGVYGEFTAASGIMSPNRSPLTVTTGITAGDLLIDVIADSTTWASTQEAKDSRSGILAGTTLSANVRKGARVAYDASGNSAEFAGYRNNTIPFTIRGDTKPEAETDPHFDTFACQAWGGLEMYDLNIGGVAGVASRLRTTSGNSSFPWINGRLERVHVSGAPFTTNYDYSTDQVTFDTNILPNLQDCFSLSTGACGMSNILIKDCSAEYGKYGLVAYASGPVDVEGFTARHLFADAIQGGDVGGSWPVNISGILAGDYVVSPPEEGGVGTGGDGFHADTIQWQGPSALLRCEGFIQYRRPGNYGGAQANFNTGADTQHIFGLLGFGRTGNLTYNSGPPSGETSDIAYVSQVDLAADAGANSFSNIRLYLGDGGTLQVRNAVVPAVSVNGGAANTQTNVVTTSGYTGGQWDAALNLGRPVSVPTDPTIANLLALVQPAPAGVFDGNTMWDAIGIPTDGANSQIFRKVENTAPVISLAETTIADTSVVGTLTTDTEGGTVYWAFVPAATSVGTDAAVVLEQIKSQEWASSVYGYENSIIGDGTLDITVTGLTTDVAGKLVAVVRHGYGVLSNVTTVAMTPTVTATAEVSVQFIDVDSPVADPIVFDFGSVPAGDYFVAVSTRLGNGTAGVLGDMTVNSVAVSEDLDISGINGRTAIGGYFVTLGSTYSGTWALGSATNRIYGTATLYNIDGMVKSAFDVDNAAPAVTTAAGDDVIVWGSHKNVEAALPAPLVTDAASTSVAASIFRSLQGHEFGTGAGVQTYSVPGLSFDDEQYAAIVFTPVTISFGTFTAVGAGAVSTAEADGTYGEFTISGGLITPNTSPLTPGPTVIGGTTIAAVADQRHFATYAECATAYAEVPLDGSITMIGRSKDYITDEGFLLWIPPARVFTSEQLITYEGYVENSATEPSLNAWGARIGPIIFDGVSKVRLKNVSVFHGDPSTGYSGADISAGYNGAPLMVENTASFIKFENVEVSSTSFVEVVTADGNYANSGFRKAGSGYSNIVMSQGISFKGPDSDATNCFIHDCARGMYLGADRCGHSNVTIQDVYTNFTTWGSAADDMFAYDFVHIGVWATPSDNTTGVTATDPHSSTGSSGDPSDGATMSNVTIAGGYSDVAFWRRADLHDALGFPVPTSSSTGAKFNDPNLPGAGYPGNGQDTYANVKFLYNLNVTGNIGQMIAGCRDATVYGNVNLRATLFGSGTPGFYMDAVENLKISKNLSPYRNTTYEFDGDTANGYVVTDDTVTGYDNFWMEGDFYRNEFVGHETKGFDRLEAHEIRDAYTIKAGSWLLDNDMGGPSSPNYLGAGVVANAFSVPTPSVGVEGSYTRTQWNADARWSGTYKTGVSAGLVGGFLVSFTATTGADGSQRTVFDSQGNTFEVSRTTSGRIELYLKNSADTIPMLKFVSKDTYAEGVRVDMACEYDFSKGIARVAFNGVIDGYVRGSDWDLSTIDTDTLGTVKTMYLGGQYLGVVPSHTRPWIGEIGLFACHTGALLGLDSDVGMSAIYAAPGGYFKDLGTAGANVIAGGMDMFVTMEDVVPTQRQAGAGTFSANSGSVALTLAGPPPATVEPVVLDGTTAWIDMDVALGASVPYVTAAFTVSIPEAVPSVGFVLNSGNGTGDWHLSLFDSNQRWFLKAENTAGSSMGSVYLTGSAMATATEQKWLVKTRVGSQQIWIDGVLALDTALNGNAQKSPILIGAGNIAGGAMGVLHVSNMWYSIEDNTTAVYSDFYDGGGNAVYSGTVAGMVPLVDLKSLADWNASTYAVGTFVAA